MLHLLRMTQHSEKNKMTQQNLAVVFAPNIIRSRDEVPCFSLLREC